jgi:hypothetical protein
MGGLLTKKATLRFGIEAVVGTNPGLTSAGAIEVEAPDFTTNPTVLKRNYSANDLSQFSDRIGRILAGFTWKTNLGGNGKCQSGLLADVPIQALLLQACGMQLQLMDGTGTNNTGPVVPNFDNPATAPVVAWAKTATAVTITAPVFLTLTVVLGGASGVATVSVTSNDTTQQPNIAATVITSGTPFVLGNCGTITPTWAGNLVVGQKWGVAVFSKGCLLRPISDASLMKTGSFELNFDGLKHEGNAAMGTFSIEGQAGNYAPCTFNFTTTWVDPVDAVAPNDTFTNPIAPMVQLAAFTWGGNNSLMIDKFTLDMQNKIEARSSVNSAQGYFGCRITDRTPQGGFDPEMEHEGTYPFWNEFKNSKTRNLFTRVGTDPGNTVAIYCPMAQGSDLKYQDRNGLRTYQNAFMATRLNGDDEVYIAFC